MPMNGITLTTAGNLTRDPEFSTVGSGKSLAKFSLAIERSWRTADGEWDKAVSYLDVVCWGNLADDVANLLKKGTRIVVSGRLDQQTWDDKETGAKRSRLELTADEVAISLRHVESFERRTYGEAQPVGAGARNGGATRASGARPSQPASRPAPQASYKDDGGDIWDN